MDERDGEWKGQSSVLQSSVWRAAGGLRRALALGAGLILRLWGLLGGRRGGHATSMQICRCSARHRFTSLVFVSWTYSVHCGCRGYARSGAGAREL
jgi:hypothetical protein